jgi:hypothetical protein
MARRTRLAICMCFAGVLSVGLPAAGGAKSRVAPAAPSLSMTPIEAKFVDKEFATHYTVDAFDLDSKKLTYRWTLELELVDRAGAKHPTVADAAAAVDLACNNHRRLVSDNEEFVWRHGDPPKDNCDHRKMGPKGHQGIIVLVVTDGTWLCTAEYEGTNDGRGKAPRCGKDDATVPLKLRSAIGKIDDAIGLERAAIADLDATPPRLAAAYDKVNRGRMELHAADDLIMNSGAWNGGDTLREAWMLDLEVLWNINITNSPHVPRSPLNVELDMKRLENAIKLKERERARVQRVLRTRR